MKFRTITLAALVASIALVASACGGDDAKPSGKDTVVVHDTTVMIDTSHAGAAADSNAMPVTLPVLDAFFADSTFAADLKSRLSLSDAQVDSLRAMAREETAKLRESDTGSFDGRTMAARELAAERINAIIGPEKGAQLMSLLRERWAGGAGMGADSSMAGNRVPTDTRIVVNAPAYRMDLFENGKLVRSYKVGIGYPEFPLPTGMRTAKSIIFNPTWTPPDEPWVESSKKAKVGQTVPAGSSLNPLGIAKIPIGLPSLIHGGKAQAKIGDFASHGCVGLTDRQMREFSMELARIGGAEISDSAVNVYGKNRKQTQTVELKTPIPVELRYQTIVAEDGKLHIYRDVYDYNTNTEANLRAVLSSYGVSMEQLSDSERTQTMAALREMSRDAKGRLDSAAIDSTAVKGTSPATASADAKGTAAQKGTATQKGTTQQKGSPQITRSVKGKKEIVIPIAALQGKGYPAPMDAPPASSKQIVSR